MCRATFPSPDQFKASKTAVISKFKHFQPLMESSELGTSMRAPDGNKIKSMGTICFHAFVFPLFKCVDDFVQEGALSFILVAVFSHFVGVVKKGVFLVFVEPFRYDDSDFDV